MISNLNHENDYVLLSAGKSKSWFDFRFLLKESQLIFFKEKISISSFVISIFINLFLGVIFQKILMPNILLCLVFLVIIVFLLIYNKILALNTTTFDFEKKLIVLKKINKSIPFSEVVEILFLNGKVNGVGIAEIQLITHQEKYLLSSHFKNESYFESMPKEAIMKLESFFKLNKFKLL